jgi:cyclohexa-1,5-dienecarbonyl-CoA hydratase
MPAVSTAERNGALWVSLGRNPLNVLDLSMMRALSDILTAAAGRRDLRAVVLRSGLEGTFSAGSDVRDHARDRAPEMLRAFHALIRQLQALPQCSVAAVDGRCLGGGCELALSCDVVLATARATFGQPEIDLACFPPVAAAVLPRLAGRHAAEMVLLGEAVPADRALRMGLVNRITDDVDAEADRLVDALTRKSGAALALARRAVRSGAAGTLTDALDRNERLYVDGVLPTEDAAEGVRAFLEKRPPRWNDR